MALAVAVAGCGGNGDDGKTGGTGTGTQGNEARDVVLRYFQEAVAQRSEPACATYLTKHGVRDIYGQETCTGVVDFISGPVRVESAEQSGDTARVVVYLSAGTQDKRIVNLKREGGSLKIDSVERSR